MKNELPSNLQGTFVETLGNPIPFGNVMIVQGDRWDLDGPAVVEIRFLGSNIYIQDSIRLSFRKKGRITLSDATKARALAVEDRSELPRWTRHFVEPKGETLLVYNAYEIARGGKTFTESWTGNAGMIVEEVTATKRIYSCSNGRGEFDQNDLQFEVSILPVDTPWLPIEIYR